MLLGGSSGTNVAAALAYAAFGPASTSSMTLACDTVGIT